MNVQAFFDLFSQYGLIVLFAIVFLEYLNMPGLPAGIIMPAAGMLVAKSELNIVAAIIVSVVAGLLGSFVLYGLGYLGGATIVRRWTDKSPKIKKFMDKSMAVVEKYGNKGLFFCRLIPVLRTIVSIPAGIFKINLMQFTLYSLPGIFCWNFAFILFGYFVGKTDFRNLYYIP